MESFSVKEHYTKAIVNLWKRFDRLPELNVLGCEYRKSPLVPAAIMKNTLLFVGINPASCKKTWQGYSFDFEKDFDTELGTYTIPLNGKKVPIFFSGMLSGQEGIGFRFAGKVDVGREKNFRK